MVLNSEPSVNGRRRGIRLQGVERLENEGGAFRVQIRRTKQARLAAVEHGMQLLCTYTPISAVMARDVVCVEPKLSVEALTALFLERGLSRAPVVDAGGKPIGMVSKTDLLREVQDRGDVEERISVRGRERRNYGAGLAAGFQVTSIARATVGEIMKPLGVTLPETASLAEAIALIAMKGVHHIPVVRSDGKVVGMFCALDAVCWLAHPGGRPLRSIAKLRAS